MTYKFIFIILAIIMSFYSHALEATGDFHLVLEQDEQIRPNWNYLIKSERVAIDKRSIFIYIDLPESYKIKENILKNKQGQFNTKLELGSKLSKYQIDLGNQSSFKKATLLVKINLLKNRVFWSPRCKDYYKLTILNTDKNNWYYIKCRREILDIENLFDPHDFERNITVNKRTYTHSHFILTKINTPSLVKSPGHQNKRRYISGLFTRFDNYKKSNDQLNLGAWILTDLSLKNILLEPFLFLDLIENNKNKIWKNKKVLAGMSISTSKLRWSFESFNITPYIENTLHFHRISDDFENLTLLTSFGLKFTMDNWVVRPSLKIISIGDKRNMYSILVKNHFENIQVLFKVSEEEIFDNSKSVANNNFLLGIGLEH